MSEWREVALGEVLTLQRGFDITKKMQRPGSIPVVSSSGISSFHDEARAEGPGVAIGRKGSLGTAFFLPSSFWPHDTTLWVKEFKGNDPYFCYLALKTLRLGELDAGSSNPTLNRNHAHLLPVGVPSVATQRRIAAVLSAFDELIEINERRIEVLEDLARSLYREWFVRFRFPGHEAVEFVDSELGPIPERWEALRLGEIAQLRYGRSLPATKRRPGPFAVVSSAGVVGEHDDALVEGPGIVLGRKGNVGSVWWLDDDFFPIDTTYYVTSDLPLGFLYWQLSDLQFDNSHAAVPGLSRDHANSLLVIRPDQATVRRFGEHHMRVFNAIAVLSAQSEALIATRDLLLPRLVTGRLEISDIDLGALLPAEAA